MVYHGEDTLDEGNEMMMVMMMRTMMMMNVAMTTMEIRSCVRMDDWRSYSDQNVDKLRRLS